MNRKLLKVSQVQRINRLLLPLVLGLIGALNSWAESELYFIHSDHLGTPKVVTDENQTVVWKAEYTPFGEATVDEDPDNDGTDVNLNLRFPGQYFDEESGLNYNYFRDYDPTTGRYIQSDPIGLNGGINTYAYVYQNPIMFIDPEGDRVRPRGRSGYGGGGTNGGAGGGSGQVIGNGYHTSGGRYVPPSIPIYQPPPRVPPNLIPSTLVPGRSNTREQELLRGLLERGPDVLEDPINERLRCLSNPSACKDDREDKNPSDCRVGS